MKRALLLLLYCTLAGCIVIDVIIRVPLTASETPVLVLEGVEYEVLRVTSAIVFASVARNQNTTMVATTPAPTTTPPPQASYLWYLIGGGGAIGLCIVVVVGVAYSRARPKPKTLNISFQSTKPTIRVRIGKSK